MKKTITNKKENLIEFIANEEWSRIDKFLAHHMNKYSRSSIQEAIKNGYVTNNQKVVNKNNVNISKGDIITIFCNFSDDNNIFKEKNNNFIVIPNYNIPIRIVFEDQYIIVINKQPNLTIHSGAGTKDDTLVNALVARYGTNLSYSNTIRPGIFHRLDRDTSGLMIIAKNDHVHQIMVNQLKERRISRLYIAIVYGNLLKKNGTIETLISRDSSNRKRMRVSQISGRNAITHYKVKAEKEGISIIECRLETGRTHQIRVHMDWIGHPIIGDKIYFHKVLISTNNRINNLISDIKRQALHSYKIEFYHPISGHFYQYISSLEEDIIDLYEEISK
ncbi:RluA family pseudouridine synthase [Lyticum sinuosum]|uniref:Pseudouridine synthase n=1 Tax=Lyticum sinuosum TaxID=1332059 RepID=A0AAE5AHI6_9RICK|nr:RluA family pseudouridine synthase [Lyticum sinuosum]MDZ5761163.1 RluA family ribosomal large subunit pseudouridine synthase [Lyticum sinuosum]